MQSITFDIESLELAKELLPKKDIDKISYEWTYKTKRSSHVNQELVNFGKHSFVQGMYNAYAEHRPFVLSPDIIWLLISQGFSHHVNFNAEKLRHLFVDFKGKKKLTVENQLFYPQHEEQAWEKIIPEFSDKIREKIKDPDLIDSLFADFSTSTETTKFVSVATTMNTFKKYFNYEVFTCICGIPTITLEGNEEDWIKIKDKIKALEKYELEWWTNKLYPIIDEIINSVKGKHNIPFWVNMFKAHTPKVYGASETMTGWMTQLFPYYENGNKTGFENIRMSSLPFEIIHTDFIWKVEYPNNHMEEYEMVLLSGFIGLQQDEKTKALKPEIGWMVAQKPRNEHPEQDNKHIIISDLKEFPDFIFKQDEIEILELNFIDLINPPVYLNQLTVKKLYVNGTIYPYARQELIAALPNSYININGKICQEKASFLGKIKNKIKAKL